MNLLVIKKRINLMRALSALPLKQKVQFVRSLDDGNLLFLLHAMNYIITGENPHFRLNAQHSALAAKLWSPYKPKMLKFTDAISKKQEKKVIQHIRNGGKEGLDYASVLVSAIPLIHHLMRRSIFRGDQKNRTKKKKK